MPKTLKLQEFTESEQTCISNKISLLVKEGKSQDEAIAIAIDKCAPEKSRQMREGNINYADILGEIKTIRFQDHEPDRDFLESTKIGDFIRSKREEKEITIEELTSRIKSIVGTDVDETTIGRIENGKIVIPSDPMLSAIAKALNISKKELLDKLPKGKDPGPALFKDKNMTKATGMTALPGGKFTAVHNPDDTWTIKDVPIFATHKFEDGTNFGINWLKAALAKGLKRLQEDSYTAPLHANHHEKGKEVKRIGSFIPKRVGKITYEGKTVSAIFADMVGINEDNYQSIKRGEFPYRSVEIGDVKKPEIASLALLSDDVPYFRLANLTIGKEIKATKNQPVLAYSSDSAKGVVLFKFGGNAMPEHTEEERKKKEEEEKNRQGEGTVTVEEVGEEAAERGDKLDVIIDMLKKLIESVSGAEETPMEEEAAETEPVQMGADVAGRFTAMEKRVNTMEKEKTQLILLANAKKDLEGFSYDDGELVEYSAKKGELDAYVAAIKKHGIQEPPEMFDGILPVSAHDPKEVTKYQEKGPEFLAKARKASRLYDQLPKDFQGRITREAFLEDQFNVQQMVDDYRGSNGGIID